MSTSTNWSSRRIALVVAVTVATVVGVTAVLYSLMSGLITSECPSDGPSAPAQLFTRVGSGEMVFDVYFPTWPGGIPEQRIANLTYELATYLQGSDLRGPGNLIGSGPLSSLNTTGDLQFHDMAAEGWFTPGDFFILVDPPPVIVQLRILMGATTIAFNPVLICG